MKINAALAVGMMTFAVALAGCSDDADSAEKSFDEAVDAGESCARLFEIRNEWDPDSPLVAEANETLRSIGCYSSTSERTDH